MGQNFKTAIITTLATVFVALSTPAHALTNGDLYRWCKKLSDNGFEGSEVTYGFCYGYFMGISSLAADNCDFSKEPGMPEILAFFAADREKINQDAAIQKYVNTIKNEPEKWRYGAHGEVLEAIKAIAPCE